MKPIFISTLFGLSCLAIPMEEPIYLVGREASPRDLSANMAADIMAMVNSILANMGVGAVGRPTSPRAATTSTTTSARAATTTTTTIPARVATTTTTVPARAATSSTTSSTTTTTLARAPTTSSTTSSTTTTTTLARVPTTSSTTTSSRASSSTTTTTSARVTTTSSTTTSSTTSSTTTSIRPTATTAGSSDGSDSYISPILAQHNNHRANHSAVALGWDTGLANTAQKIAASCSYGHDTSVDGGGYGQNIGAGYKPSQVPAMVTNGMYNGEVNYYPGYTSEPSTANFGQWGHFSQIVWNTTTKVGCYTQYCPQGLANTGGGNIPPYFTVCNYSPPGNYIGQFSAHITAPRNDPTVVVPM